jgi:hypothetical protein
MTWTWNLLLKSKEKKKMCMKTGCKKGDQRGTIWIRFSDEFQILKSQSNNVTKDWACLLLYTCVCVCVRVRARVCVYWGLVEFVITKRNAPKSGSDVLLARPKYSVTHTFSRHPLATSNSFYSVLYTCIYVYMNTQNTTYNGWQS